MSATNSPGSKATSPTFDLIVDIKQRRPACVLLQAAFGCPRGAAFRLFDHRAWLVSPTDNMRRVSGTMEQWRRFADEANAAVPPPPAIPSIARR